MEKSFERAQAQAREMEHVVQRAFQEAQACSKQVSPMAKRPALDEAINAIHDEVMRYCNSLQGLIDRLESPRPMNCGSGDKNQIPTTIGEALQDIFSVLVNCNDMLQATNRRIDEQVGDLKLLP